MKQKINRLIKYKLVRKDFIFLELRQKHYLCKISAIYNKENKL